MQLDGHQSRTTGCLRKPDQEGPESKHWLQQSASGEQSPRGQPPELLSRDIFTQA